MFEKKIIVPQNPLKTVLMTQFVFLNGLGVLVNLEGNVVRVFLEQLRGFLDVLLITFLISEKNKKKKRKRK